MLSNSCYSGINVGFITCKTGLINNLLGLFHYQRPCSTKLQPAIFPLFKHVIRFHKLPAKQCNPSYNRAFMVDWSLSGITTSQLVIRESEWPWPASSSILISLMTSSSVNNPYIEIQDQDTIPLLWQLIPYDLYTALLNRQLHTSLPFTQSGCTVKLS